jgi:Ca2+-binding EF-hand superfamily protein
MKTTAIAIALLSAGFAAVQATPPTPEPLTWFLRLFDANNDGVLDAEERLAARKSIEQKRADFIAKWDANGDGWLSFSEMAAIREAVIARIEAIRLEKFNDIAGDDSLISPEEFAAIPALADKDTERVNELFEFLDKDDSGFISFDEFNVPLRRRRL